MPEFYRLCTEAGRRNLFTDLSNDYYEMVQDILANRGETEAGRESLYEELTDPDPSIAEAARDELKRGSGGMISRIRITFKFTSAEGLETTKMFHDMSKVEHFLLWDRAYQREVKGVQKKPDWSQSGLCQYQKEITLGVAKFRGQEFKGFRKDFRKVYYAEASE